MEAHADAGVVSLARQPCPVLADDATGLGGPASSGRPRPAGVVPGTGPPPFTAAPGRRRSQRRRRPSRRHGTGNPGLRGETLTACDERNPAQPHLRDTGHSRPLGLHSLAPPPRPGAGAHARQYVAALPHRRFLLDPASRFAGGEGLTSIGLVGRPVRLGLNPPPAVQDLLAAAGTDHAAVLQHCVDTSEG